MAVYDIGDGIRITATFTNLDGALQDPTAVVFRLLDPQAIMTTPSFVRDGTGLYHVDILATSKGTWQYRWEGTGVVTVAEESTFTVRASNFIG
jgi:hypothetical protein